MTNTNVPPSNEGAAFLYREAQAARLLRYCQERGVDAWAVFRGDLDLDLEPICGPDGKIAPEQQDFQAGER